MKRKITEQCLAQARGVAVAHMVHPALHAGGHVVHGDFAASVSRGQPAQLARIVYTFSPLQATMVGEGDEAQEGNAFGDGTGMGARCVPFPTRLA